MTPEVLRESQVHYSFREYAKLSKKEGETDEKKTSTNNKDRYKLNRRN